MFAQALLDQRAWSRSHYHVVAERVDWLEWQGRAIIIGSAGGEKNPETLTTQEIVCPVTDAKSKHDLRSELHSAIRGRQDVDHVDDDTNYS